MHDQKNVHVRDDDGMLNHCTFSWHRIVFANESRLEISLYITPRGNQVIEGEFSSCSTYALI